MIAVEAHSSVSYISFLYQILLLNAEPPPPKLPNIVENTQELRTVDVCDEQA